MVAFPYHAGKILFESQVIDATARRPVTLKQALIRCLGYYMSLLPFAVGFLWILIDRRRQGWHDKLANTVVLRCANIDLEDEAQKDLAQIQLELR